mmetsp:Transcript_8260/g.29231  ORF Transcript_8260/g.29231 Transcript_8260/m.29231 type:complete len:272 (+) Transcript_8260:71-886(+)
MPRLGGPNSNLHARIGGMTRSSLLNSDARSLAMRVRGGASGDTGEDVTAAFATALAKRRRDSAPAAVKAGAAGLERDVVQSILRAIDAPPTSPSKSPAKKKPKGRCFDGARVLITTRRGQSLHVKVCAAYNASTHEYDFDGEEGAANSICALGKRIFDGELTVGTLKKKSPEGAPFFDVACWTMREWSMDDKKYQEKRGCPAASRAFRAGTSRSTSAGARRFRRRGGKRYCQSRRAPPSRTRCACGSRREVHYGLLPLRTSSARRASLSGS